MLKVLTYILKYSLGIHGQQAEIAMALYRDNIHHLL